MRTPLRDLLQLTLFDRMYRRERAWPGRRIELCSSDVRLGIISASIMRIFNHQSLPLVSNYDTNRNILHTSVVRRQTRRDVISLIAMSTLFLSRARQHHPWRPSESAEGSSSPARSSSLCSTSSPGGPSPLPRLSRPCTHRSRQTPRCSPTCGPLASRVASPSFSRTDCPSTWSSPSPLTKTPASWNTCRHGSTCSP